MKAPRSASRAVRRAGRLLRTRRRLVALASAVILVLAIAGGIWLRSQWTHAQEIRSLLIESRAAMSVAGVLDDPAAAGRLSVQLGEAEDEIFALQRSLRPLAAAARVLGWLPFIGDDLRAAPRLVDRAAADLAAAHDIIGAGTDLRSEFLDLGDTLFAGAEAGSIGAKGVRPVDIRRRLARAASRIETARGYALEMNTEGLRPSLKEVARLLESEEERIAIIADWGLHAVDLLASLRTVAEVSGLLADRDVFSAESLALLISESSPDLVRLSEAAWEAREHASTVQATLPTDVASSSLAAEIEPLETALRAVALTADGAALGLQSVEEAINLLDNAGGGLLRDGERLGRILEILAGASGDLQKASGVLAQAADAVSEARREAGEGSVLADGLERVGRAIDRLVPVLRFADTLGEIGPGLLGIDGERTYLLLGQSADELRATGGFVFAVWAVTLIDGELGDIEYFDIVEVDDKSKQRQYPVPPPGLENHMNAPMWLMRDVSWDPDFPTTAQMAQHLFHLGRERSVDGVLALNQWAMQHILEVLGPIEVEFDGAIVDVANFISVIEAGTDSHGRAYADAVLRATLDTLSGKLSTATVLELAERFQRVFDEGDFLAYSNDPVEQASLHSLGWDGAVDRGETDYVFVVDSNVGWNKVDRSIERGLSYEVSFSSPEELSARLTLSYRNLSDLSATCDRQWTGGEGWGSYEELKNACYWDFVRVYVPDRVSYLGGDRIPLPPNSVYEDLGLAAVGDDTLALRSSHGKTVISGLIALPPPETRQLTFNYALPSGIVRRTGETLSYELLLQAQPGARGRETSIVINPPAGWVVAGISGPPADIGEREVHFRFTLAEDTRIRIQLERVGDSAAK